MTEWIRPPLLAPGSEVRVIAPSGPFDARLVWRAMGWLAERYRVRWDRRIFDRNGYLAGDDAARRSELEAALAESGVAAVFCARGGYGGNRFAQDIDWTVLRRAPRWLVGFSDITALHVEAAAVRVASVHGPNLTGLGRGDAATRERVVRLLEEGPVGDYVLTMVHPGIATGRLCGGNLSLLHSCAVAGRLRLPPGGVLLVEEVGERPYRIDRMLTTLVAGRHLDAVSAVVIGDLDRCGPGPDGLEALDVACRCLAPLGVPVAVSLPVGHGVRNDPVVLGAEVTLDDEGRLRCHRRA